MVGGAPSARCQMTFSLKAQVLGLSGCLLMFVDHCRKLGLASPTLVISALAEAKIAMDHDVPGAPLRYGTIRRQLERWLVPSYHKFCVLSLASGEPCVLMLAAVWGETILRVCFFEKCGSSRPFLRTLWVSCRLRWSSSLCLGHDPWGHRATDGYVEWEAEPQICWFDLNGAAKNEREERRIWKQDEYDYSHLHIPCDATCIAGHLKPLGLFISIGDVSNVQGPLHEIAIGNTILMLLGLQRIFPISRVIPFAQFFWSGCKDWQPRWNLCWMERPRSFAARRERFN